MLKHLQKSRFDRAWPLQAIRSLGRQRKTAIPNPHKKVITIPTIRDNEIIRFKPSISVKDDLIHGGIPKYEIEEEYGEDDDDDDDDDEITIGNRASKAILQYGRVRSRHIDAPPDYLRERAKQVCDQRTTNQIHRLVKSWMVKHDLDRTNRYRKATLGWGPHNEAGKLQQAEDEKYREKEQRFVYGPNETMVYTSFHLPARFSILRRIFDDIKTFQPKFVPHRMLDFGCGPATAGLAAHAVWGANEDAVFPIQQYSGVDLSQGMLDAARIMVKDVLPNHLFFSRSLDVMQRAVKRGERYSFIVCSYTLSELPSDAARQAAVQMLYELLEKDGIVVFVEHGDNHGSHTVRTARHYLQALTQSLDKRGKFSFASLDSKIPQGLGQPPRTPETLPESSMMLPLVPGEFSSYADMGARTLAPCTHDEVCPLYPGKKCTFMQRVSGGLIRKNAEEKFAYAVLRKVSKAETTAKTATAKSTAKGQSAVSEPSEDAEDDTVDGLMKKVSPMAVLLQKTPLELMNIITSVGSNAAKWNKRNRSTPTDAEEQRLMQEAEWLMEKSQSEAWESYAPEWKREEWARIFSTPIKSDGHVIFDLCMPTGKMRRFIQARSSLRMLPGLYTAVRKSTLGGMMPVYFQGHERMLSAEINAQKVLEEARREKNAKFEKAQKRRNQMDDDDDDDDVDFFADEAAPPSQRGALTKKPESAGVRRKTHVAQSLEELAEGDGNMTFELNPSAIKARSSSRRGARAATKEPEEMGGQELDADAASALEDFKKMLAEQMSAPSTPPRTRRTRRRRSGQESAEEISGTESGEMNDRGSNNSSAVSESTEEATEVKPRRGRRRPVY